MTDDLLHRLVAAPEGSRELDAAIHDAVSWLQYPEEEPPPYSTSLDAALQWENIRFVAHRPDGTVWAWHEAEDGESVIGVGHTEPLARRIAALKAKEQSDEV